MGMFLCGGWREQVDLFFFFFGLCGFLLVRLDWVFCLLLGG